MDHKNNKKRVTVVRRKLSILVKAVEDINSTYLGIVFLTE